MARADRAVAEDMVFLPFAYVEAAANILTNPALDPYGKIPEFKYSAVRVEAANIAQNDLLIAGWLIPAVRSTRCNNGSPASLRRMFSAITSAAVEARVSEARWGTTVTLGWPNRVVVGNGSVRNTSNVAWANCPLSSAAIKPDRQSMGHDRVDHIGTFIQVRQRLCIQNVFSRGCIRQQQDNDVDPLSASFNPSSP